MQSSKRKHNGGDRAAVQIANARYQEVGRSAGDGCVASGSGAWQRTPKTEQQAPPSGRQNDDETTGRNWDGGWMESETLAWSIGDG